MWSQKELRRKNPISFRWAETAKEKFCPGIKLHLTSKELTSKAIPLLPYLCDFKQSQPNNSSPPIWFVSLWNYTVFSRWGLFPIDPVKSFKSKILFSKLTPLLLPGPRCQR